MNYKQGSIMQTVWKFLFFLILSLFSWNQSVMSQISINSDGSTPDSSAMLEIKSNNKGLLLPRIDFNNRPLNPATGLLVFITANSPAGNGLYVFDGIGWLKIGTTSYYEGQQAAGGVVFYVDPTGQHGLVAAPMDQGIAGWGCDSTLIGPGAEHFGINTGDTNTAAIVAGCNQPLFAAKICDTLMLNGYSDWFLPSADEMDSVRVHGSAIGGLVPGDWYWSSTEWDDFGAAFILNDPGFSPYWVCSKTYNFLKVRCVRKF
jgi:hypothetical protein